MRTDMTREGWLLRGFLDEGAGIKDKSKKLNCVAGIMVNEKMSRIAMHDYLFLEDWEFNHGDLIEIKTMDKPGMIKKLREKFVSSNVPEHLTRGLLDVAIVFHIRAGRYRRQDLDNLAKIVLDALEKPKIDDGNPYLFEDDNQVVRLLLYKIERTENADSETSQISISARIHDTGKNMILRGLNEGWGNGEGEF